MNHSENAPAPAEAVSAITDALHRYCLAVDRHDASAFLALCAPGASMDFGSRYRGPASGFMDALLANPSSTLQMRHEVTDITIRIVGDTGMARSRSTVHAEILRQSGSGIERRRVRGTYEDHWISLDGHWLLQHRRYLQLEAFSEITTKDSS